MEAPRIAVYAAINQERDYQDEKWAADRTDSGGKHTVDEWLVYIRDYIEEAMRYTSRHSNPGARTFVKHSLRKVAAMCVAALEQNGVETRATEGPRPEGFVAQ